MVARYVRVRDRTFINIHSLPARPFRCIFYRVGIRAIADRPRADLCELTGSGHARQASSGPPAPDPLAPARRRPPQELKALDHQVNQFDAVTLDLADPRGHPAVEHGSRGPCGRMPMTSAAFSQARLCGMTQRCVHSRYHPECGRRSGCPLRRVGLWAARPGSCPAPLLNWHRARSRRTHAPQPSPGRMTPAFGHHHRRPATGRMGERCPR